MNDGLRTSRNERLGLIGVALSGVLVFSIDPALGLYPSCPSQLLLGLDCPMCGGLRGTFALLHGDFPAFVDHNALLVVLYPLLILLIIIAFLKRIAILSTNEISPKLKMGAFLVISAGAVIFTVIRNVTPYWGSGLG